MIKTTLVLFYGVVCYLIGLAALAAFVLVINGLEWAPFMDRVSATSESIPSAIVVNIALLLLFGVQHSLMARTGFKVWWTRIVPRSIERSTYVLFSGAVLFALCLWWQPLPGWVWDIENSVIRTAVYLVQVAGWLILIAASLMINHFELFGLQQVYYCAIEKPEPQPVFTTRFLYKWVRHPIQLGVLIGIWAIPTMTTTQAFLSAGLTFYVLIGLYFEEKDLVREFGDQYREYQGKVGMLIPGFVCSHRSAASGR